MRRLLAFRCVFAVTAAVVAVSALCAGASYISVISSFTAGISDPWYWHGFAVEYDGSYLWTTVGWRFIKRVYPTGSIINTVRVYPFAPHQLAYDGRYLYTTDCAPYNEIYVVDPSSGSTVSSWPFPVEPCCMGLAYDGRDLFAVADRHSRLWRITTGGSVISSYEIPINTPSGLAYDDDSPGGPYLWCCDEPNAEERNASYIYQLTTAGSVVGSAPWPIPGSNLFGLAFDGTYIWCIETPRDWDENQVYRVYYFSDVRVTPASVGKIKALFR